MNADERQAALRSIARVVPSAVFDRLINVLTMIEERTNDALVHALSNISTEPTDSFIYHMKVGEREESITPIREILDLCEGWFITSTFSLDSDGRGKWDVESLIGKELPE